MVGRELRKQLYFERAFGSVAVTRMLFVLFSAIIGNIVRAVEGSRRTILILTPEFATSPWTEFETAVAYRRMVELKSRLLPIMFRDITQMRNLSRSLQYILKSIVYIQWPGQSADSKEKEHFWERVKLSLPKKRVPPPSGPPALIYHPDDPQGSEAPSPNPSPAHSLRRSRSHPGRAALNAVIRSAIADTSNAHRLPTDEAKPLRKHTSNWDMNSADARLVDDDAKYSSSGLEITYTQTPTQEQAKKCSDTFVIPVARSAKDKRGVAAQRPTLNTDIVHSSAGLLSLPTPDITCCSFVKPNQLGDLLNH